MKERGKKKGAAAPRAVRLEKGVRPMHEADFMAIAGFYIRGLISEEEKDSLMNAAADWYEKHPAANPSKSPRPRGRAAR